MLELKLIYVIKKKSICPVPLLAPEYCRPPSGSVFITDLLQTRHDDVIKWKHFPRYWPFVRGIHRSPVNSPHKGQWRGALMFSLIWVWINGWIYNHEAGDLRRYRAHYDVTVMVRTLLVQSWRLYLIRYAHKSPWKDYFDIPERNWRRIILKFSAQVNNVILIMQLLWNFEK